VRRRRPARLLHFNRENVATFLSRIAIIFHPLLQLASASDLANERHDTWSIQQ
jgi:hypothetical protein